MNRLVLFFALTVGAPAGAAPLSSLKSLKAGNLTRATRAFEKVVRHALGGQHDLADHVLPKTGPLTMPPTQSRESAALTGSIIETFRGDLKSGNAAQVLRSVDALPVYFGSVHSWMSRSGPGIEIYGADSVIDAVIHDGLTSHNPVVRVRSLSALAHSDDKLRRGDPYGQVGMRDLVRGWLTEAASSPHPQIAQAARQALARLTAADKAPPNR
jgi:hypothetical protein